MRASSAIPSGCGDGSADGDREALLPPSVGHRDPCGFPALAGDEAKAVTLLAEARKDNAFVEPYLTGAKRMPSTLPDYYSPGEESEAQYVAVNLRPAWKGHGKAVAWLKAQA